MAMAMAMAMRGRDISIAKIYKPNGPPGPHHPEVQRLFTPATVLTKYIYLSELRKKKQRNNELEKLRCKPPCF
jgi:hypothetical protein